MFVRRPLHRLAVLALLAALVGGGLATTPQPPAAAASAPTAAVDRPAVALPSPWTTLGSAPTVLAGRPADVVPVAGVWSTIDRTVLEGLLAAAPEQTLTETQATVPLQVLAPDGRLRTFAVHRAPVMEPGLAAAHPEIRTFAGQSVDQAAASIRLDLGPLGFHASVRGGEPSWYVDPVFVGSQAAYVSYLRSALPDSHGEFVYSAEDGADAQQPRTAAVEAAAAAAPGPLVTYRQYRLGLVNDPTYATYWDDAAKVKPGTPESDSVVLAAKTTLMSRVNQVYEADLAIHMDLVDATDKLNLDTAAKATGANGPCGAAACFTSAQLASCGASSLTQNIVVVGQLVGASNYDIGHLGLGVNGGGIAGLGVVGRAAKARGCTGLPKPQGDFYAVDYVAHEMGHEFAGDHTFNGTQANCSATNRNTSTNASPVISVEPGSGSSIMAYAGICNSDNLQKHSDPYFSQGSQSQISAYTASAQANIPETQTVSLYDFGAGRSFVLGFRERAATISGDSYSQPTVQAAVNSVLPAGTTATVRAWGALRGTSSTTIDTTGFEVDFDGTVVDQPAFSVSRFTTTTTVVPSGFVGETHRGGAVANKGSTMTVTTNHAPVVSAPATYVVPQQTPFTLTGSATDAEGTGSLTYLWEQNDAGTTEPGTGLVDQPKNNGPLFRVFGARAEVSDTETLLTPSPHENVATAADRTRTFPDLAQIIANNTNAKTGTCPVVTPQAPTTPAGAVVPYVPIDPVAVDCYSEFLPTAAYTGAADAGNSAADNSANPLPTLHMRLTARDNTALTGGYGFAETVLQIANAGPFLVTSQPTAVSYAGKSSQAVTWDVAGTGASAVPGSVNAPNVRVSLSTDGGYTYPYELLASTPNSGTATVTMPDVSTTTARIRVEGLNNVFFDLNDTNFTITPAAPAVLPDLGVPALPVAVALLGAAVYVLRRRSGQVS